MEPRDRRNPGELRMALGDLAWVLQRWFWLLFRNELGTREMSTMTSMTKVGESEGCI